MDKIDWGKAPQWADRVVRGGTLKLDYWANDCKLQPVNNSCPPFKTNSHIREDFPLVERRPTVDTGIDWSKAPDWADRVVRLPGMRHLYWADDTQRQSVEHGHYRKDNDHVKARWEVVERRFLDDQHLPPKTFNCKCTVGYRTIEQRIASLRALEKQVEEIRAELTRDLEALGLTWMVRDEPEQPTITDWRDLRVGDVVEHVEDNGGKVKVGSLGSVCKLDDWRIIVDYPDHEGYVYSCPANSHKFRFIRRP